MRASLVLLVVVGGCLRSEPLRCRSDGDCLPAGVCDQVTLTCALAPPDASVGDLAEPPPDAASDALLLPDAAVAVDGAPPDLTVGPRGCDASTQCLTAEPVCSGATCRACGTGDRAACAARDPATPRCDELTGSCAPCRTNQSAADCPDDPQPVCGSDGRCRICRTHAECASGICKPSGACAAASEIALVDNRGMAPAVCAATGTHDGTTALTAYCDVQDAILGTRPYVKVTGYGEFKPYGPIDVARTVTVVGPGRTVAMTATLKPGGAHAVNVEEGANLTLDGVDITGAAAGVEAVFCQPATNATLAIFNSIIHANGGVGIRSDKCFLTADANEISANTGGGMNVQPPTPFTYNITNNFIFGNGTMGPGVVFIGSGAGTFTFNTVANNTWTGNIGGISCSGTRLIQASIVWGNNQSAGTSIETACHLQLCDIDEAAPGPGNFDVDPQFINAGGGDYRLSPGSQCADRVLGGSFDGGLITLTDHDAFGTPRPRNGAYDVGAHEL